MRTPAATSWSTPALRDAPLGAGRCRCTWGAAEAGSWTIALADGDWCAVHPVRTAARARCRDVRAWTNRSARTALDVLDDVLGATRQALGRRGHRSAQRRGWQGAIASALLATALAGAPMVGTYGAWSDYDTIPASAGAGVWDSPDPLPGCGVPTGDGGWNPVDANACSTVLIEPTCTHIVVTSDPKQLAAIELRAPDGSVIATYLVSGREASIPVDALRGQTVTVLVTVQGQPQDPSTQQQIITIATDCPTPEVPEALTTDDDLATPPDEGQETADEAAAGVPPPDPAAAPPPQTPVDPALDPSLPDDGATSADAGVEVLQAPQAPDSGVPTDTSMVGPGGIPDPAPVPAPAPASVLDTPTEDDAPTPPPPPRTPGMTMAGSSSAWEPSP